MGLRKRIELEAQRALAQKLMQLEEANKKELLKRIESFEEKMKETARAIIIEELDKIKKI